MESFLLYIALILILLIALILILLLYGKIAITDKKGKIMHIKCLDKISCEWRDRLGRWVVYIGAMLFLESVTYLVAHREALMGIKAIDFIALAFAANRFGRAIAFNGVAEPIRHFFSKVVHDTSGAGEGIEPAGSGVRHGIGELLTCPICSGTWAAVLLANLMVLDPLFGKLTVYGFGAAGISELLQWMNEHFAWSGRYYREMSGSEYYKKVSPSDLPETHKRCREEYLKNNGNGKEK